MTLKTFYNNCCLSIFNSKNNSINKNKLQLSSGIESTFSDIIRYPNLSKIVNNSTNEYGAWPLWFPTDDLNKTYTFTIWNQNLVI